MVIPILTFRSARPDGRVVPAVVTEGTVLPLSCPRTTRPEYPHNYTHIPHTHPFCPGEEGPGEGRWKASCPGYLPEAPGYL